LICTGFPPRRDHAKLSNVQMRPRPSSSGPDKSPWTSCVIGCLDAGNEPKEPRVEGILWPQEEGNPSLRPSNIAAVEISVQEPKPQHPAREGTKVPIFVTLASNS
jgi:hypothetical protein